MKTAFEILKERFLLIENDKTVEAHTHLVIEAMEHYAKQKLNTHSVMQAEVSDGVKGAAVADGAVGQNVGVGLCKHEEVIYHKGYICKQCDLPILC